MVYFVRKFQFSFLLIKVSFKPQIGIARPIFTLHKKKVLRKIHAGKYFSFIIVGNQNIFVLESAQWICE